MKELIFDFDEFKRKVDLSKPVHCCVYSKCVDPKHGVFYRLEFWITGLPKDGGKHIVCFYAERRTTIAERENDKKWCDAMVERFAKPLGATEGEWKE